MTEGIKMRTRFAPSPTGYMHVGNLRTAIYEWLLARSSGGTFILRIEDTDQVREVEGATERLIEALGIAGVNWDEGPDIGGPCAPYIQSERRGFYKQYAEELIIKGKAYRCFCTKERLDEARQAAEGDSYKYDKHCLRGISAEESQARAAAGEPYVIRFDMPTQGSVVVDDIQFGRIEVDCAELDDIIIMKTDGFPTYNFANVVDDHLMNITHVLRGTEFLSSTPKYNLLYEAFGWEKPVYIHVPPVMRNATQKLSKRLGDPTFEDLLGMGFLREAIINYIVLVGWNPGTNQEFFTLDELIEVFSVDGLSKSPALFDMEKLKWFNAEYVRKLSAEQYFEIAEPWLAKVLDSAKFDFAYLCRLLHTRTERFDALAAMVGFLNERPEFLPTLYEHKKMKSDASTAKTALEAAIPALKGLADWTEEGLHACLMEIPAKLGLKNGQVLWPVRIAMSGQESTPGGAIEVAYLLGRDETIRRLGSALENLNG